MNDNGRQEDAVADLSKGERATDRRLSRQDEAAEIERLRGLVLEVLDYWDSGNWRILYVEHMRNWRKRALDTLGPIAPEEAAKVAANRSSRPASAAVVVNVPIATVRV